MSRQIWAFSEFGRSRDRPNLVPELISQSSLFDAFVGVVAGDHWRVLWGRVGEDMGSGSGGCRRRAFRPYRIPWEVRVLRQGKVRAGWLDDQPDGMTAVILHSQTISEREKTSIRRTKSSLPLASVPKAEQSPSQSSFWHSFLNCSLINGWPSLG